MKREVLMGLGLGAISIALSLLFGVEKQREIWGFLLIVIGAIYIGFAISDGRMKEMIIEISIASVFIAIAIMGIWYSIYFLIGGYFLHGLWDLVHSPKGVKTDVQKWYPPFCLIYDSVIGLWLLKFVL